MAVVFINMTLEDFLKKKTLQKYMSLENALSSLKDNYFWFARPNEWPDPFEKRFLECKYILNDKETDLSIKTKVLCCCFTELLTNEAQWKMYGGDEFSIQFRFDRQSLLKWLEALDKNENFHVYIGKVIYKSTETIMNPSPIIKPNLDIKKVEDQLSLLLFKRLAYAYEEEIRIFLVSTNIVQSQRIKIDSIKNIISRITIDPKMKTETLALVKSSFCNHISNVYQSSLYKNKKYKTIEL